MNWGIFISRIELGILLGNIFYFFKIKTNRTQNMIFFRWKGENVATSEVEAVISNIVNLNDAVVYGVEVNITKKLKK